ncbi:MAG: hypothetical protein OEW75_03235 [Cyclobacteriaceae bacterium]|nr:hypothetical protein [Cyclobacteriaceae bacterium]
MTIKSLKNISLSQYESFLELCKCKYFSIKGGHVKYTRSDLTRPIIFQTHINPVPEMIIRNGLKSLGYSKSDFFQILDGELIIKEISEGEKIKKYSKVKKDT